MAAIVVITIVVGFAVFVVVVVVFSCNVEKGLYIKLAGYNVVTLCRHTCAMCQNCMIVDCSTS